MDTARIPLYLVAGPSFRVWSEDKVTQEWLADCLLPQELGGCNNSLWQGQQAQLNTGILLRLDGCQAGTVEHALTITELLLYAVVSPTTTEASLPTPPGSSSPRAALEQPCSTSNGGPTEAEVYALPLSSERCYKGNTTGTYCTTAGAGVSQPQFFTEAQEPCTTTTDLSRKRQQLSSVFDEAQQQRRKLKGGGGMAKTMAGIDAPFRQSTGIKLEDEKYEGRLGTSTDDRTGSWNLSRIPSISSVPDYDKSRPRSRRDTFTGRPSTLDRVESQSTIDNGPIDAEGTSCIEEQNKTALTRVVMAGMRLFGLQQHKKGSKSRAVSELPCTLDSSINPVVSCENEDTYKLIYHQTFKASLFTFRAYVTTTLISQEAMREVVDRFLSIFCTDPFSSHLLGQGQTLGQQSLEAGNAFDVPRKV